MNLRHGPWRGALGGLAMLAVVVPPMVLVQLLGRSGRWSFGHPHVVIDADQLLWVLPGVAVVALLAPLVGLRRWYALFMCWPLVNLVLAWVVGTRAAKLRVGPPAGVVADPVAAPAVSRSAGSLDRSG